MCCISDAYFYEDCKTTTCDGIIVNNTKSCNQFEVSRNIKILVWADKIEEKCHAFVLFPEGNTEMLFSCVKV